MIREPWRNREVIRRQMEIRYASKKTHSPIINQKFPSFQGILTEWLKCKQRELSLKSELMACKQREIEIKA